MRGSSIHTHAFYRGQFHRPRWHSPRRILPMTLPPELPRKAPNFELVERFAGLLDLAISIAEDSRDNPEFTRAKTELEGHALFLLPHFMARFFETHADLKAQFTEEKDELVRDCFRLNALREGALIDPALHAFLSARGLAPSPEAMEALRALTKSLVQTLANQLGEPKTGRFFVAPKQTAAPAAATPRTNEKLPRFLVPEPLPQPPEYFSAYHSAVNYMRMDFGFLAETLKLPWYKRRYSKISRNSMVWRKRIIRKLSLPDVNYLKECLDAIGTSQYAFGLLGPIIQSTNNARFIRQPTKGVTLIFFPDAVVVLIKTATFLFTKEQFGNLQQGVAKTMATFTSQYEIATSAYAQQLAIRNRIDLQRWTKDCLENLRSPESEKERGIIFGEPEGIFSHFPAVAHNPLTLNDFQEAHNFLIAWKQVLGRFSESTQLLDLAQKSHPREVHICRGFAQEIDENIGALHAIALTPIFSGINPIYEQEAIAAAKATFTQLESKVMTLSVKLDEIINDLRTQLS